MAYGNAATAVSGVRGDLALPSTNGNHIRHPGQQAGTPDFQDPLSASSGIQSGQVFDILEGNRT